MTVPVTGMRYGLHVGFLHGRTPFKRLDKLRKCIHAQPCIHVSLHPVVLPRVDVLRVRLQVRDLYCDPRTEPDVWRTPLGALYLDGPVQVFRHPTVLKVSKRMPCGRLYRAIDCERRQSAARLLRRRFGGSDAGIANQRFTSKDAINNAGCCCDVDAPPTSIHPHHGRVPKGARRQVLQIKWQLFGMAMFLLTEAWWALPASVANPSRR